MGPTAALSKKSDLLHRIIAEVEPRWPYPTKPKEGLSLIEHGMVLVLMRHMAQDQAEASLLSLRAAYDDWNEARVSQVQEIASHFKNRSKKKGVDLLRHRSRAAFALKEFLQEVFQKTHGLELEFLRDDAVGADHVAAARAFRHPASARLLWP